MASELVEIADAVVTALNTQLAGWGYLGVTATRDYLTTFVLHDMAAIKITAYPHSTVKSRETRGLNKNRPRIDVDVRRYVGADSDKALRDGLMTLTEHIEEFALLRRFTEYAGGDAHCMDVETSAAFQTEEMREKNVFAAVVALTFQVLRVPK